ncbi:hypothetical protein BDN71DRAFT_1156467 [Pleurotus eryngii]|uniref:Uncharacterized protein n=1 Tax=Pleurotus eryngii TaxID=5323 RepID=A0A9P5ZVF5_PLEER|nr:hypothetical protein BDN71DRAFT_1156467 [Pleurotus eryngii]
MYDHNGRLNIYAFAFRNRRSVRKLGAGLAAESRSFTNHILSSVIAGKSFSRIRSTSTPLHNVVRRQTIPKAYAISASLVVSHVDGDVGIALPFIANFAAGAIAGISEILVFYPLDVVSTPLYWRDAGMKIILYAVRSKPVCNLIPEKRPKVWLGRSSRL